MSDGQVDVDLWLIIKIIDNSRFAKIYVGHQNMESLEIEMRRKFPLDYHKLCIDSEGEWGFRYHGAEVVCREPRIRRTEALDLTVIDQAHMASLKQNLYNGKPFP